jgi:hypothetical protein
MDQLQGLGPVSERYAALPVRDAFNWQDSTVGLGDGEWYLVAFRSVRRAGADDARLTLFDELAHQEAMTAPGFVHYFKGPQSSDGSCLSFCLWNSRADARAAAGRPDHVRAVSLIEEMYESYTLEFHRVARDAGGRLTIEPYDAAPGHAAISTVAAASTHGASRPAPRHESIVPHHPIQATPAV